MTSEPLRIDVLGAARISALSIVTPARETGHRLVAVAARDRSRAEAFAATHGVERGSGSGGWVAPSRPSRASPRRGHKRRRSRSDAVRLVLVDLCASTCDGIESSSGGVAWRGVDRPNDAHLGPDRHLPLTVRGFDE